MLSLTRRLTCSLPAVCQSRLSFSSIEGYYENLDCTQKFTNEEQFKLLDTLNSSNKEELVQLKLSVAVASKLHSRKTNFGPFKNMDDVLEVDGLGMSILKRFSKEIEQQERSAVDAAQRPVKVKRSGRFVYPQLQKHEDISSITGIYISPNGFSWAHIDRYHKKLEHWDYFNVENLPEKLTIFESFKLARKIISSVPPASVYVFESSPKHVRYVPNPRVQETELKAMTYAMLKLSKEHLLTIEEDNDNTSNQENKNVHHLKYNTYQRLFSITTIGSGRTLTDDLIKQILESENGNFSLPCTPISVESALQDRYNEQRVCEKELMSQALLMTISFVDLCVYRNSVSLAQMKAKRSKTPKVEDS